MILDFRKVVSVAGLLPDNFGINFKRQQRRNDAVAALLPLPTDLKIGWKYCVWNWKAPNSRISITPLLANRINLRFEDPTQRWEKGGAPDEIGAWKL